MLTRQSNNQTLSTKLQMSPDLGSFPPLTLLPSVPYGLWELQGNDKVPEVMAESAQKCEQGN